MHAIPLDTVPGNHAWVHLSIAKNCKGCLKKKCQFCTSKKNVET